MRERLLLLPLLWLLLGITPARAGKTEIDFNNTWVCRDHPRSCGKDILSRILFQPVSGSPPLVRERPASHFCSIHIQRITPARAGKTTTAGPLILTAGDHPRSCGKDLLVLSDNSAPSGSPPLVRERPTTNT